MNSYLLWFLNMLLASFIFILHDHQTGNKTSGDNFLTMKMDKVEKICQDRMEMMNMGKKEKICQARMEMMKMGEKRKVTKFSLLDD